MLIILLKVSRGDSDIIEARSCSHCCSARAISITYYEGVFVALGNQQAMSMRHSVMCELPDAAIVNCAIYVLFVSIWLFSNQLQLTNI